MKNIWKIVVIVSVFFLPVVIVPAGGTGNITPPPRALLVADHLRAVLFEEVTPGVSALRTIAANGVEIIALRINPAHVDFDLAEQKNRRGERVDEIGNRTGAQIVFNGGFFRINKKGDKYSVGFLARNNVEISPPWKKSGGYLVFRNLDISISPTRGQPIPIGDAVLQSKPMLIEPGSKWAMNTNRAIARNRTLVCTTNSGDVVVLAIAGMGLSLFEAGWLMRGEDVGGVFDCDSALAMDGGGSTQIWVKNRPDLSFAGETPVHNAIVIRPRSQE